MKLVPLAFFILCLLSGCLTNTNSIFRPDFTNKSKSGYPIPPPDTRQAAKQNATQSTSNPRRTDLSHHHGLNFGSHERPARISSELNSRNSEKTPLSVDQYYRQQLSLHKGDTMPGYAPPPAIKKDDSWWYRLFGASKTLPPSTSTNCYEGILTKEGVTCQAMRTGDGRLLTLGGALRGFGPGDRVCVCGPPSVTSFCQQGTTIYIALIDKSCP